MVDYRSGVDSLTVEMFGGGFFDEWPTSPDAAEHLRILQQSDFVEVAVDDDDQLVGFATAVSDGALSAYVPLLEVLPTRRGRGVGTELMRRLLARLADLYIVDIAGDEISFRFTNGSG